MNVTQTQMRREVLEIPQAVARLRDNQSGAVRAATRSRNSLFFRGAGRLVRTRSHLKKVTETV